MLQVVEIQFSPNQVEEFATEFHRKQPAQPVLVAGAAGNDQVTTF